MNYFVTGATGFIGRHLVAELLKREGTIYVLVREGSRGKLDSLVQRLGAPEGRIVPVTGDLSKPALGIEGFTEPIDHFFHLAAVYDMTADEDAMERANTEGTAHVVEFANSIEVGRFHHTSSIAVAGDYKGVFQEDMFDEGQGLPHAYHRTKYESERLVREGVRAKIARSSARHRRRATPRPARWTRSTVPTTSSSSFRSCAGRYPSGPRWPARRAARPTSSRSTSWPGRWTTSRISRTRTCRATPFTWSTPRP